MIALKDLKACRHDLHQNVETLRVRTVKLYQDNMVVCEALRKMSSKCPVLMTEIKDLVPWLHETRTVLTWSTFEVKQTWWILHRANGD
jgi:hypothetical protein